MTVLKEIDGFLVKVYCPTGPGGGQDPTCSPGGKGMMVGAKRSGKSWVLSNGDPLPDHLPKNIPPAWKNVKVALDPKADLLVKGRDAKGRVQSVYSQTHATRQAAKKFARTNELRSKTKSIQRELNKDLRSKDTNTKENAAALLVIQHTGIRPGGRGNTKAEKQAYGATTLEGRHVRIRGSKMYLEFVGKKGVNLKIPVTDSKLKSMLKERKEASGPRGKLFETNDAKLRIYTKKKDGGSFKPKDFRTAKGTSLAAETMKSLPKPKNQTEYKKRVREVAKVVSQQLGNTPTVALQSYIDPTVFSKWRIK